MRIRGLITGAVGAAVVASAILIANAPTSAGADATAGEGIDCDYGGTYSISTATGRITLPDGNTMFTWGYKTSKRSFQLPGPVLCVTVGDHVTISLTNNLPEATSLIFPGQTGVLADGVPSMPESDGARVTSLAKTAKAKQPGEPSGGTVTYEFDAMRPGTFLYESGTDSNKQVEMGLYGAIIVRPAAPNQAYDAATAYESNREFLHVLAEVDPALHLAVEKGKPFDWSTYSPKYFLLNGRSAPDTLAPNNAPWLPNQPYGAMVRVRPQGVSGGDTLPALVRYINVSSTDVAFHPHGNTERVIAEDASPWRRTRTREGPLLRELPGRHRREPHHRRHVQLDGRRALRPGDQPGSGADQRLPGSRHLGYLVVDESLPRQDGSAAVGHRQLQPVRRVLPHGAQPRPGQGHQLRGHVRRTDDAHPDRPAQRLQVSGDMTMNSTQQSPARKALGVAAAAALVAAGAGLAGPAVANAAGASTARATAARPTAVVQPSVVGTVLSATAPAGSAGQGPVVGSDCVAGCDIWATAGTVRVHDSATTFKDVPVWSFAAGTPTAVGSVTNKSAVLEATAGQLTSITLHNTLGDNVGLSIPQLDGFHPDIAGVGNGGDTTYTFTPTRPGTYVYQAALSADGSRQVAMGLVGALIVRPAAGDTSDYGTAENFFDDESVLVYTDLDTNLAAAPGSFNMRDYNPQYHLINGVAYPDGGPISTDHGRTLLTRFVNGSILEKSPTVLGSTMTVFGRGTRPVPAKLVTSGRTISPGDTVDATFSIPNCTPVAPALECPGSRIAIFDTPGKIGNGGWINGTNSPALGGAIAFIQVGGTVGVTAAGPAVTSMSVVGSPGKDSTTRPLSATAHLNTADRGLADVGQVIADPGGPLDGLLYAGEYYVDTVGLVGTGTKIYVANQTTTDLGISFPIDLTPVLDGSHTLYLRGLDATGAWGPLRGTAFRVDKTGPLVTFVTLNATYTNGLANLTYSGTIDETTTGGSNVVNSTRAWLDTATPPALQQPDISIASNGPRVVAAVSGVVKSQYKLPTDLPADPMRDGQLRGLTEGVHTLYIQGQDQYGQLGTPTATQFTVDKTPLLTSAITLRPTATNGLVGNPAKPGTIGITADIVDPVPGPLNSPITVVEAYLNTVAASGSVSGIQMTYVSTDSTTGSSRYTADMPLSWIGGFKTSSTQQIWVVAKDAAGNRGPGASAPLNIDKEAPTTTSASLVQGVGVPGDTLVTVTVNGHDVAGPAGSTPSGIGGGEWWIGNTDPGVGLGNPMTIAGTAVPGTAPAAATGTIDLNAIGQVASPPNLTVHVRVKDAAGNWASHVVNNAAVPDNVTVSLTLRTPVAKTLFVDGFEAGILPGAWTSQTVSGTGAALSLSPVSPIAGLQSLQASTTSANNTATAYVAKDLTGYPSRGQSFSAHFSFAPGNGSTSALAAQNTTSSVTVLAGQHQRRDRQPRGPLPPHHDGNRAVRALHEDRGDGAVTCTYSLTTGATSVPSAAIYNVAVNYTAGTATQTLVVNGVAAVTLTSTTSMRHALSATSGSVWSPVPTRSPRR